jgi:hypothetical protein
MVTVRALGRRPSSELEGVMDGGKPARARREMGRRMVVIADAMVGPEA